MFHLFAILAHLLLDKMTRVKIVSHELFDAPKLHVLIHQLRHVVGIVWARTINVLLKRLVHGQVTLPTASL